MKFLLIGILISLPLLGFTQDDIKSKLKAIDEEILEVESLIQSEERSEIFELFLIELNQEKNKYLKLTVNRPVEKDSYTSDPTLIKTMPKAVAKKADHEAHLTNESVPLHKRYDLLLREISNTQDILIKLSKLKSPSEATRNFMARSEERLTVLEKMKIDSEIKFSELEDKEYSEFKQSGLRVGAMMDFYYQYDFNRADNSQPIANRNYNNRSNDFTLNLLELNVFKSFKNLDFYADLDFGQFAEQNSSHNSDPDTHHIGQAFIRYKLMNDITITAGKFYSHVGLEVAKAIDNRNYSRPLSFTLGIPFWHEGVSVYKSGLGPFGIGLYYYDRTDIALENNTGKAYGSQVSYVDGSVSSFFNFITGAETQNEGNMRTIYEWNIVWAAKENLSFAWDTTYGSEKNATTDGKDTRWLGLVGYADYKFSSRDNLCLRIENFRDLTNDNATSYKFNATNPDINRAPEVMSYTLTNRYNMKNGSEIRAEWRTDQSTQKIYPRKNGKFSDHQDTLTVAWLYSI
jgi:hypothetical protein